MSKPTGVDAWKEFANNKVKQQEEYLPSQRTEAREGHDAPSCISLNSRIRGEILFSGVSTIDGGVEGVITSRGELTISETGEVYAPINGDIIKVEGHVKGDISATTAIELRNGSVVIGDIKSPNVVIEDGAVFSGRCSMPDNASLEQESTVEDMLNVTHSDENVL